MEVYKVNSCTEEGIDLKSQEQLESLLKEIKDSSDVMIKWDVKDEDEDVIEKKSKILLTDNLMPRIKDGRFSLTSTVEVKEE